MLSVSTISAIRTYRHCVFEVLSVLIGHPDHQHEDLGRIDGHKYRISPRGIILQRRKDGLLVGALSHGHFVLSSVCSLSVVPDVEGHG